MSQSSLKKKAVGKINIEDKMVVSYNTNCFEIALKFNERQIKLILPQIQKIIEYHNNTYSLPLNYSMEILGVKSNIKLSFVPYSTIHHLSHLKDEGLSVLEKYGFEVEVDFLTSARGESQKLNLLFVHFLNSVKGLRRIELDENTNIVKFTVKVQRVDRYQNSTTALFKELSHLG